MIVEVGRRYRLVGTSVYAQMEGVIESVDDTLVIRPDGSRERYYVEVILAVGGQFVEIDAKPPLAPTFGNDPDERARLRRVFETWDFRTGT